MKQDVEIIAYIFTDAGGTLRALRFVDGIRLVRKRTSFEIQRTESVLPEDFFSANVSHVAAIVGSNSSGKSTVIQDINRILAGQRPVAARYALVICCDQGTYQLCSHPRLALLDGQAIPVSEPAYNTNLKVVFYAGGYDPLGRTKALVPPSRGVESVDISDQFVYSTDAAHDFDYKLIYLRSLIESEDSSLFLGAEKKRKRTIRFEASAGGDIDMVARDFLEFALTLSNDRALFDPLLASLGYDAFEDRANYYDAAETKLILREKGTHFLLEEAAYFERLYGYLQYRQGHEFRYSRLEFALALGCIVTRLHAEPDKHAKALGAFHVNFVALLTNVLGKRFRANLGALRATADNLAPDMFSEDGASISITFSENPAGTTSVRAIVPILLELRRLDADFSFRFTGISEGQRTLLTFYSRLFMQAIRHRHTGNTLLLIDEHEHGLHPEWQRRYLHELLTFLKKQCFATERYQIVMSTHSPFLVSDLPSTHVNRIGTDESNDSPTLAANLLQLLLSPLFLENSTGEFSRQKIEDILAAIGKARTSEEVDSASVLLPLLGDDLIRNYCEIRAEERKSILTENQANQRRRMTRLP